jgi:hypothetical protein
VRSAKRPDKFEVKRPHWGQVYIGDAEIQGKDSANKSFSVRKSLFAKALFRENTLLKTLCG